MYSQYIKLWSCIPLTFLRPRIFLGDASGNHPGPHTVGSEARTLDTNVLDPRKPQPEAPIFPEGPTMVPVRDEG